MGLFKKKNYDNQELIISRPKPPVSITRLVALRTSTTIFLLLSAVMLHLCVILRPWKQEWVGSDSTTLEFSLWKVCRNTVKGNKCYEGEYDDAPDWFLAVRWFLMLSVIIQYLSVIFVILKLTLTKNAGQRHFWVPAFMSLTSAVFTLTAMLLLVGYREFDFLDESRMFRMGWKYEGDNEDRWAWPYYATWCTFSVCLLSFLLCMYTQVKDSKYAQFYAMEGLKKQAQSFLR